MFIICIAILLRVFSNSYVNVFQKILTKDLPSSVINCYTYCGVCVLSFLFCLKPVFSFSLVLPILCMGMCGCLGNYFIVKALSCGELSELAPINSYKPVVALLFGIFMLNETPSTMAIIGILLILYGTYILYKFQLMFKIAYLYRFLALIFSAIEAIFIKKIILLSNIPSSFFYWALSGFIFSLILTAISKKSLNIKGISIKLLLVLTGLICLMQYTTNYVFSKINVSSALAIFQLSTLLSVFLGISIFKEKELFRKICSAIIMCIGAILVLLN